MKIIHMSDTHIGCSTYGRARREDFFKAFEKAVSLSIDAKPDVVIHTGDLFDVPNPDVESMSFVVDQLKRFKDRGIKFISVSGNHDRIQRAAAKTPQDFLQSLGLLKALSRPEKFEIDGVLFAGFPYVSKFFSKSLKERFFPLFQESASSYELSVLMLHQGLSPYLSFEGSYEFFASELPSGFKYYAAGHVHRFIKDGLFGGVLSYAGVTEYRTVDDAVSERGINVVELKKGSLNLARINIPGLRRFIRLSADEESMKGTLERLLDEVPSLSLKPVVFVKYTYRQTPPSAFNELFKKLKDMCLVFRVVAHDKSEPESFVGGESGNFRASVFERAFSSLPQELKSVAHSIASESPESVEGTLKEYLRRKFGINL